MPVWVRRRKRIWFDHIHLSLSTVRIILESLKPDNIIKAHDLVQVGG